MSGGALTCLFCGGVLGERMRMCPHCGCTRPRSAADAAPLTGRDEDVARLHAVIDRLARGDGGLTGIAGDPGIGKTRMLEAALSYCKSQRMSDFVLRGFEPTTDLPYWALIEALQNAVDIGDATPGRVGAAGISDVLQALNNAKDQPAAAASTGMETRDAAINARIFEAVSAVLRGLTAIRPLCLFVDDLQWVDTPTLNLLRYALRLCKTLPLLIICAFRWSGEADARWRPLLEDAAREGLYHELHLSGLATDAARRLARTSAAAPLSDRALDEVVRLAEGNPFYVGQLARAVVPAGGAPTPLPPALRGIVDQRLTQVSPLCRSLIQAVAVFGRPCPLEMLPAIVPPPPGYAGGGDTVPLSVLSGALDEALHAHVLFEDDTASGSHYNFAHALLREAVVRDLNALTRAALHQRVAEALDTRRRAGARIPAAQIAGHVLESRGLAGRDAVLSFARAAADESIAMGSAEQQVRFLTAVVEALAEDGNPAPAGAATDETAEGAAAEIATVRLRLIEAYGALDEADAAVREAERVLTYYRARGDQAGEVAVHAAVAGQINPRHRPREVIAHADAALALLGDRRAPLTAHLRFLRAHAMYQRDDITELQSTSDWLRAGGFDPPEPHAELWWRLLRVLWQVAVSPDAAPAISLCREAAASSRALGDRRGEAVARLWEGELLNRDARPKAALLALDEARRLAQEDGSASLLVDAGALRAEALLQLARWDDLERTVDETVPALIRLRTTYFGYAAVSALGWSRRLRGLPWTPPAGLDVRFNESQWFITASRSYYAREFVEFGPPATGDGAAAGATASIPPSERTMRLLDWLVTQTPERGPGTTWATAGVPLLGTLALAGRAQEAAARYEGAARFPRFLQGPAFGPLECARTAVLLKRWEAAEAHFDAAVELATAEGLQTALARTLVERGNLYRLRGRRGDRARAAAVLSRAVTLCAELDLTPDRLRAEALLGQVGPVAAPVLPAGLTRREADVLRLLAQGSTNRQIAQSLTISEKTVEQHLLNLYQKLHVDSRAKAVAFAFAHHLVD